MVATVASVRAVVAVVLIVEGVRRLFVLSAVVDIGMGVGVGVADRENAAAVMVSQTTVFHTTALGGIKQVGARGGSGGKHCAEE